MTISATSRQAGPFIGDGTTAIFPFLFKVFDTEDLEVATLQASSGAIDELVLDSDFSATLNADQDSNPGGSITLLAGNLATGFSLTITTDMAEEQTLELTNGGAFYPDTINDAFDRIVILIQQLQVGAGRAIRTPFPDSADMLLPSPALRAGKLLMFDGDGNLQLVSLATGSSSVIGAQQAAGAVDGVNKDFTFQAAAGPTPTPQVFAGGIFQSPTEDYGVPVFISGTTWKITLTEAPAEGPVTILLFA